MFNHKLTQKIAEIVGLRVLRAGLHSGDDHSSKLNILSVWCSEIWYFQHKRALAVSIIHSDQWRRGIILTEQSEVRVREEGENFIPIPLVYKGDKYVDLDENWDDPVASTLHAIDIMHQESRVYTGSAIYSYELFVDTGVITTELACQYNQNPQWIKLWDALFKTATYLANLYGDEEMIEFVDRNRYP